MSRTPSNQDFSFEEDAILSTFLLSDMSTSEIASTFDLPFATVALRRAQLGYHRPVVVWTAEMDDALREMVSAGRSLPHIRRALGVSRRAVYKRLVDHGMRARVRRPVKPDPMIAICATIARASTPYWVSDETQRVAIDAVGRALRAFLNDPRLEIRLRDAS